MRFGHRRLLVALAREDKIADAEIEAFLEVEVGKGDDSIARMQAIREKVHDAWKKMQRGGRKNDRVKPDITPEQERAYVEAVVGIARHRRMAGRVTLTDLVALHQVLMSVMARLADFAGMFERDLYFAMLGHLAAEGYAPKSVLDNKECEAYLSSGQIIKALATLPDPRKDEVPVDKGFAVSAIVEALFGKNIAGLPAIKPKENKHKIGTPRASSRPPVDENRRLEFLSDIRNNLSHFNTLHQKPEDLNLTALVNQTRTLMSYDRKLKNAVSQSIKDLMLQQSLRLTWSTTERHELADARIAGKTIKHLGGKKLKFLKNGKTAFINENLCSKYHLEAMATIFCGGTKYLSDVVDLDLDTVAWTTSNEQRELNQHAPSPKRQRVLKSAHRRRDNVG